MAVLTPVASLEVKDYEVTVIGLPDKGKRKTSSQLHGANMKRRAASRGTTLLGLLLSVLTVVATTVACYRGGHQVLSWKPGPGRRALSEVGEKGREDDSVMSELVLACLELQEELGYQIPDSPPLEKDEAISQIIASMEQLQKDLAPAWLSEGASTPSRPHPPHSSGLSEQRVLVQTPEGIASGALDFHKHNLARTSFPALLAAPAGLTSPAQLSLAGQAVTAFPSQQESVTVSGAQAGLLNSGREGKRGGDEFGAAPQQSHKRRKPESMKSAKNRKEALPGVRKAKGANRRKKAEILKHAGGDVLPPAKGSADQPVEPSAPSAGEGVITSPSPPLSPNSFLEFLKAPPESLPSSPEPSSDSERRQLPNASSVASLARSKFEGVSKTSKAAPESLAMSSEPFSDNRGPPQPPFASAVPSAPLSSRSIPEISKAAPESLFTSSEPSSDSRGPPSLPVSSAASSPPSSPDSFLEFLKAPPESLPSSPESSS
ncbi:hypothetical protein Emag_000563 [Eimeria magna]